MTWFYREIDVLAGVVQNVHIGDDRAVIHRTLGQSQHIDIDGDTKMI